MRVRICVRADAFGNALGNYYGDQIKASQQEKALQAREDARDAAMSRLLGGGGNSSNAPGYVAGRDGTVGGYSSMNSSRATWDDEAPPSVPEQYAETYGGETTQTGDRLKLSRGRGDDLDQQIKDAKAYLNMLDRKDAARVATPSAGLTASSESELTSMRQENLARMMGLANQPNAGGMEVPYRVEVCGTSTYDCTNVGDVSGAGGSPSTPRARMICYTYP